MIQQYIRNLNKIKHDLLTEIEYLNDKLNATFCIAVLDFILILMILWRIT